MLTKRDAVEANLSDTTFRNASGHMRHVSFSRGFGCEVAVSLFGALLPPNHDRDFPAGGNTVCDLHCPDFRISRRDFRTDKRSE